MKYLKPIRFWPFFVLLCAFLSGCGEVDRTPRVYQEVHFSDKTKAENGPPEAQAKEITNAPPPTAGAGVSWTPPEGWTVRQPTTMRVGSFRIDGADVSIIPSGGSLDANVNRWIGQVGEALEPDELTSYMKSVETFKTEGAYTCHFVDLAKFATDEEKSIMGGIILRTGDLGLFVKMTGPKSVLEEQKEAFRSLCTSIR